MGLINDIGSRNFASLKWYYQVKRVKSISCSMRRALNWRRCWSYGCKRSRSGSWKLLMHHVHFLTQYQEQSNACVLDYLGDFGTEIGFLLVLKGGTLIFPALLDDLFVTNRHKEEVSQYNGSQPVQCNDPSIGKEESNDKILAPLIGMKLILFVFDDHLNFFVSLSGKKIRAYS